MLPAMPILRGAITFSRFKAEPSKSPKTARDWLVEGLKVRAFAPIDRKSGEVRACGFVEVEDHDAVEFAPGNLFHGEWVLLAWRVDQIKVPEAAIRREMDKWAQAFERDQGRAPNRYEKADRRAAIELLLRQKAEPRTRIVDVSWNLETGLVQMWASARKSIDEVVEAMEKGLALKFTQRVPAALAEAMGAADLTVTKELAWPGMDEVSE